MPVAAGPARLVRSAQKDELYRGSLRSGAGAALGGLAGAKTWLEWQKEIELLADVAYFTLTTLSGYQTLGEEYVNIIQVDPSGRKIPSLFRRAVLICLHAVLPYLLDKGLVHLEQELHTEPDGTPTLQRPSSFRGRTFVRSWLRNQLGGLSAQQRKLLSQVVGLLRHSIPFLWRLHLAIFYLNGIFYHVSKRMAGITYLRFAGLAGDDQNVRSSYRLLGTISLLHLALTVGIQAYSFRQRQQTRQEWKLHRNLSYHKYGVRSILRDVKWHLISQSLEGSIPSTVGWHHGGWRVIKLVSSSYRGLTKDEDLAMTVSAVTNTHLLR